MKEIDPYKIASQVLEPGEKLLWAGRPEVRAYLWGGVPKSRYIKSLVQITIGVILYRFATRNLEAGLTLTGEVAEAAPSGHSIAGVAIICGWFVLGGCIGMLPILLRTGRARSTVYMATTHRLAELRWRGPHSDVVVMEAEICRLGARRYKGALGHLVWNTYGMTSPKGQSALSTKGTDEGFWGIPRASELAKQLALLPYIRHALGQVDPQISYEQTKASSLQSQPGDGVRPKEANADLDLAPLLGEDERILWAGPASTLRAGIASNNGIALKGVFVAAVVSIGVTLLFWDSGIDGVSQYLTNKGLWLAALVTLIGMVMLIWQIVCWIRALGIRYVVTNWRLLEVKSSKQSARISKEFSNPAINKLWVPCSKGTGHVLLGRSGVQADMFGRGSPIGFFAIENPSQVRAIIAQQPYAAHLFGGCEEEEQA